MESELTEWEAGRLRELDQPAIVISKDYVILGVNDAYRERYGSLVTIGQDRCHEVSHGYPTPCDQHGESCPIRTCQSTQAPARVTHVHQTPAGPEHCEIRMEPVRDGRGEVQRYVEIIRPLASASASVESPGMLGIAPQFQRLIGQLERAAPVDIPVLLLGETGTGKELAARALHEQSRRSEGPFVPVECSGLGESLFESELFGVERGAFTGADRTRDGLVAAAAGGTLFLDEIGDVPANLQTRLLRLLESRTYRRVGGTEPQFADFRLVCATHQDLRGMVERGLFRRDLYHRIRTFPVILPPLRSRRGDVGLLARAFLERAAPNKRLTPSALTRLASYDYPGNIRELRNVIEHAALLCDGDEVAARHIVLDHSPTAIPTHAPSGAPLSGGSGAIRRLDDVVRDYLRWASDREPNRRRLAEQLGLSERTLYRRLGALRTATDPPAEPSD